MGEVATLLCHCYLELTLVLSQPSRISPEPMPALCAPMQIQPWWSISFNGKLWEAEGGLGKCLSSEVFVSKEVNERHLDDSLETAARSVVWLPSVKTPQVLHVPTGYFQLTRRRLGIKDRRENILKNSKIQQWILSFSHKLCESLSSAFGVIQWASRLVSTWTSLCSIFLMLKIVSPLFQFLEVQAWVVMCFFLSPYKQNI